MSVLTIVDSKFVLMFFIILFLYGYFKFIIYSYWKKHNVPHEEPTVPLGTVNKEFLLRKTSIGKFFNFIILYQPKVVYNNDVLRQFYFYFFSWRLVTRAPQELLGRAQHGLLWPWESPDVARRQYLMYYCAN